MTKISKNKINNTNDIPTEKVIKDKDDKKSIIQRIKYGLKYSIHTWIFKCFGISMVLELVLEILGRRSILGGFKFLFSSPFVFMYNVSIIFFTLLFALFFRKRVFGIISISVVWLACGVVNFVVLGYRVTPFAAIDFMMVQDVISMLDVYFKKWQQVLLVIGILAVIAGLVMLFRKTPKFEGKRHIVRTMFICVLVWVTVIFATNYSVRHNIISDDFANLGMAYKDYGFAYCFTNSIIDNGIDKPDEYSEETMNMIRAELDGVCKLGEEKKPNIIFIQLESFFDPNNVKGLTLSENPIPTFTALKEKYPSGYLTVPALGAGTANTEFEVLTGIKSSFFGAGEYSYKTTVNNVPVEGLCSILKEHGYGTYAIHNNKASFYDRHKVYNQMGFDAFISLEYMYNVEYTSTGWAKDKTLVTDIMKCLKDTENQDFVYTISVQGHGRYPSEEGTCEEHVRVAYDVEEMELPVNYYVNQIYEMDQMIAELIDALDEFGEDYVLVLYGDHLPSLNLEEEQTEGTLFQTEYVVVNNINLGMKDADIKSYQLGMKVIDALNISGGYADKAQIKYGDTEELDAKLMLIAYDMLFGEKYLYDGERPVPENNMKMGVDKIVINNVENESDHISITGENFNEFSVVYEGDDSLTTVFVNRNTLMVEETLAQKGNVFTVKQLDSSKHILSSSDEYIY